MKNYILVIDEGTTGVRALIYDRNMEMLDFEYEALELIYPEPDEAEVDANEVYDKTVNVCRAVVKKCGIAAEEIAGVGITTQRSSWTMWNRETGEALHNVVLWFDSRGHHQKQKFIEDPFFSENFPGLAEALPGFFVPLIVDKIRDDSPEFAEEMDKDTTLFGNMDTWLIWKLTKGAVHATTGSMTSAGMVYDNENCCYNLPFINIFGFREEMLPEVCEEVGFFGNMSADILGVEIPICSAFADQQSAMFSQGCLSPSTIKCTIGTGAFVDINVGREIKAAPGLSSMICWNIGGERLYLLEGQSSTAGTCLEWAKNKMKFFDDFSEMDALADSVTDSNGVYFVPALAGMAFAPYNDESARGAFMGIGPGSKRQHFVRAMLEGIAFAAVLFMEEAAKMGVGIDTIKVSGGVTKSRSVLQTMADVTGAKVIRPKSVEATALGAAEAAAIQLGWMKQSDIEKYLEIERVIEPDENSEKLKQTYKNWKKVVERTLKWDC